MNVTLYELEKPNNSNIIKINIIGISEKEFSCLLNVIETFDNENLSLLCLSCQNIYFNNNYANVALEKVNGKLTEVQLSKEKPYSYIKE